MPVRADVEPGMITWARERSRLTREDLARRFPRLEDWEQGELSPTIKQLERFARATHAPLGFFFLPEPPEEKIPIPDFRTMPGARNGQTSPDLLDTIYLCEQRQDWYRSFARLMREGPAEPVAALTLDTPLIVAAEAMRAALRFEVDDRGYGWADALRRLVEHAEDLGILVMVSGVVGSDTHRPLDPAEFRGFALVDPLAPVVFVNGADTKAAQIFTLVHELAHIWLGQSALSNPDASAVAGASVERWCNAVAAEVLVPLAGFRDDFDRQARLTDELDRHARRYKVSTLVVLRRAHDAGFLDAEAYRAAAAAELDRVLALVEERGSGGNFYNTQLARVSRRFARAIITSTLEGRTLYREAFQLLGFKKLSTFETLADRLGVG